MVLAQRFSYLQQQQLVNALLSQTYYDVNVIVVNIKTNGGSFSHQGEGDGEDG